MLHRAVSVTNNVCGDPQEQCTCNNGIEECQTIECPPLNCGGDEPENITGCCPVCPTVGMTALLEYLCDEPSCCNVA